MLFNSYIFIFLFLPLTLAGFFLIGGRGHHRIAISWLVASSLFFYGWWNPAYLGLLLGSLLFNYALGVALGDSRLSSRRMLLVLGICANLGLIAYYKYANFFLENIAQLAGLQYRAEAILLPLAISFFTFQQIAYLVDAYKGKTREYNFLHYSLFVTFFPQLIAGPIVHHREMLPQFARDITYRFNHEHLAVGLTIFALGLFKKVGLADNLAQYATPVFSAAERDITLTFFEAWGGALAYTFQLYFDFSGYSDMAIGLARLFGVRLPLNFYSPYKATSIIDFWRCWHITLSRFLRDHIYIPLGGSRRGSFRRFSNLLATMLLGGLWHGAGWNFIIWGGLHGVYLVVNHGWRAFKKSTGRVSSVSGLSRWSARLVTFLAVVLAWVFFRAESLDGAMVMLMAMSGYHGLSLPESLQLSMSADWLSGLHGWISFDGMFANQLSSGGSTYKAVLIGLLICWLLPNTQQFMREYRPTVDRISEEIVSQSPGFRFKHHVNLAWALLTVAMLIFSVLNLSGGGEFLYFNF